MTGVNLLTIYTLPPPLRIYLPEHVSIPVDEQTPLLIPHDVLVARGHPPQVTAVHSRQCGLHRGVEHPTHIQLQNLVPGSAIRHSVYSHADLRDQLNCLVCNMCLFCNCRARSRQVIKLSLKKSLM